MQYQAVIVNFDRKSVEYIAAKDVQTPKKAVASASGSTPPPVDKSK